MGEVLPTFGGAARLRRRLFGEAMPIRPKSFRPRGAPPAVSKQERDRVADRWRGSARARGYDADWERARAAYLAEHPLCEYCEAGAFDDEPRVTPASLVDHLHPHRGDRVLFWAVVAWVAACADCHNGPKQALERQGDAAVDHLARRLGRPLRCEIV